MDADVARKTVHGKLEHFSLENIFNADETGLFYAKQPDSTLATGKVKEKEK